MEPYRGDLLNDDCWEHVFKQFGEYSPDIKSLSLVCKKFLALTNGVKTSLGIYYRLSQHEFAILLQRFPKLKSINIISQEPPERVSQILASGLELEALYLSSHLNISTNYQGKKMKSLKKLTTEIWVADFRVITELFPFVEEINIGCLYARTYVGDDKMELLASKLKRLTKISLTLCGRIFDQSLMSLSTNCHNLTDIRIVRCPGLSEKGIGFLMEHSPMLTSLSLNKIGRFISSNAGLITIENSVPYASNLEDIEILGMPISDAVLHSVAISCPALKRLSVMHNHQHTFTIHTLNMLLGAHPSLRYFEPGTRWLTDKTMAEYSPYLRSLVHINLDGNFKLRSSTFYMITKKCPLVEEIHMDGTRVGTWEDSVVVSHKNFRVNYLSIRLCQRMNDNELKRYGFVCPSLESLLVKGCPLLTDESISEIVKICPHMRLLDVSRTGVVNFLGANNEDGVLKLRTIRASRTRIDDTNMKMIGMRCPDLKHLEIKGCQSVTSQGVKEVVNNCKKIKTICMNKCQNVSVELLEWMVKSGPSLKQIVISQKDLYESVSGRILELDRASI